VVRPKVKMSGVFFFFAVLFYVVFFRWPCQPCPIREPRPHACNHDDDKTRKAVKEKKKNSQPSIAVGPRAEPMFPPVITRLANHPQSISTLLCLSSSTRRLSEIHSLRAVSLHMSRLLAGVAAPVARLGAITADVALSAAVVALGPTRARAVA